MSHETHVKLLINLSKEKVLTSKVLIKSWSLHHISTNHGTCNSYASVSALALHPLQVVIFMVIGVHQSIGQQSQSANICLDPVINDKFRADMSSSAVEDLDLLKLKVL